jgi:K(+)-stimulated pyrophosphate-energized sodium pump
MHAVGEAANSMIEEVRRQFREIPGLLEGRPGVEPDAARAVDISTQGALRAMLLPGRSPSWRRSSSAPCWARGARRAARRLDRHRLPAGLLHGQRRRRVGQRQEVHRARPLRRQGLPAHAAAVVGDTIGDPFKDTSGPSINILLKLMAIVSLIFGPLFI